VTEVKYKLPLFYCNNHFFIFYVSRLCIFFFLNVPKMSHFRVGDILCAVKKGLILGPCRGQKWDMQSIFLLTDFFVTDVPRPCV
jgi:hypothetical protein